MSEYSRTRYIIGLMKSLIEDGMPSQLDIGNFFCTNFSGVEFVIRDFLKNTFPTNYVIINKSDEDDVSKTIDFVVEHHESVFCLDMCDWLDREENWFEWRILIAGESFESVESELKTKLVEYLTVRGVHDE